MSPFTYIVGIFCLTASVLLAVNASIIDPPLNDAFEIGPDTTLRCQVSGPTERVTWTEYSTNPAGAQISDGWQVLPGHPNAARYTILNDTTSRSYDLQISPTAQIDGGLYRCYDVSDSSPPAFAQIVVIEGPANCTTNVPANGFVIEGQYYTIECGITFRGIGPNITWTGPPEDTGAPWGRAITYTDTTVWAGVNMNMSRFFNGYNFEAKVDFSGQGFVGVPNQANNIPTYGYTIPYPAFYVRWAPGNMYVSPDGPYEIGTQVECWADAFPEPTYFWQNLANNQRIDGQILTITEALVGTTVFRCNANNGIGSNDLFVNITVNAITTPTTPTTTTTTTPPPAEGLCNDLTGRWGATFPSVVDMCIEIDNSNGQVIGLIRNATDPYFIEVRGAVTPYKYDEIGFVGVWPINIGTQAFTGVCTNCFGVEYLQVTAVGRKITDFNTCTDFGQLYSTSFYQFTRRGPPCRTLFEEQGIKV